MEKGIARSQFDASLGIDRWGAHGHDSQCRGSACANLFQ